MLNPDMVVLHTNFEPSIPVSKGKNPKASRQLAKNHCGVLYGGLHTEVFVRGTIKFIELSSQLMNIGHASQLSDAG